MPTVLQLVHPVSQLGEEQILRVHRAVFEHVVYGQECRLVVHDYAGVGCDGGFTVGKCIECVYGLVRRHVGRQVDEDIHLVGGDVVYLLELDLALVLGIHNGLDKDAGGLSVRNFGYGDGTLVYLLDFRPDLYASASLALIVFRAVGIASRREVRIDFVRFFPKYLYGSVDEFVEVMRKNLRGHTHTDTFRTLCKQERESYRKFRRFLVPSVVAVHPVRDAGVEDDFLREFA